MSAIREERIIAATPGSIFNALTQSDEIAHWWTNDLTVKPEVGSLAEFRFTQWGAGVLQFEVAELVQDEKVRWISRGGPPHWIGTGVTWQLTHVDNGTQLIFTHDGFTQVDKVESVRGNWDHYLHSLKSYLETGKGTPGGPLYIR